MKRRKHTGCVYLVFLVVYPTRILLYTHPLRYHVPIEPVVFIICTFVNAMFGSPTPPFLIGLRRIAIGCGP